MRECRDIEPLLTPYVDGEAGLEESVRVEGHLARCQSCRATAQAERDARRWLQASAAELRGTAPAGLDARCRQLCTGARPRSRWMLPAAVAASVCVVAAGFGLALLSNERQALAAELSADHERCFARGIHTPETRVIQIGDHSVVVPPGEPSEDLTLTGLRRCRIRGTLMAHALYRSRGRPVSLYVAPRADSPQIPGVLAIMEGDVRTWATPTERFALVGHLSAAELEQVETLLRGLFTAQQ